MKRILQISILALLLITYLMIGMSYADTHAAADCERATVVAAIAAAARGDTVTIAAGDCTWNSTVSFDKALTIQGAGKASTFIRSGITVTNVSSARNFATQFLLYFNSATPASDANETVRITGITFDMNYRSSGIAIVNSSNTALNKVILDNCDFLDSWDGGRNAWSSIYAVSIYGRLYGVAHSNRFYGLPRVENMGRGSNAYTQSSMNYTNGTENDFFWEDNQFIVAADITTASTYGPWWIDIDAGATATWRYNSFSTAYNLSDSQNQKAPYSPHHPETPNFASKGGAFYGNYIESTVANDKLRMFDPRAGKNMIFYNQVKAVDGGSKWYMYNPSTYIPGTTSTVCGTDTYWPGESYCAVDGQPQHVWHSYQWNNRTGAAGTTLVSASNDSTLVQTKDYNNYNANCSATGTCSVGVGCGSDTPTGNCTTGTGFWKTAQSCSDLTDFVGTSPTTPIDGALYRCNPTNTWNVYYTPYAYPHPLRGEADTTAPTVNTISPTIEQACNDASDPYTASSHAISFNTSEPATCRYTIGTTEAYADLDTEFTGAGTTSHSGTVVLTCGQNSTIYYACQDDEDTPNVSDTASWTFGVSQPPAVDEDGPILSSLTVTNQSCATTALLVVGTSEPATCRWCKDDAGVTCNSATVWASRTQFTQTVDTVHHDVAITQACSSSATYNILCQDTIGNESSNLAVPIATDAAKAMSITVGGAHTITLGSGGLSITVIP